VPDMLYTRRLRTHESDLWVRGYYYSAAVELERICENEDGTVRYVYNKNETPETICSIDELRCILAKQML
jgi:hypothetical protein